MELYVHCENKARWSEDRDSKTNRQERIRSNTFKIFKIYFCFNLNIYDSGRCWWKRPIRVTWPSTSCAGVSSGIITTFSLTCTRSRAIRCVVACPFWPRTASSKIWYCLTFSRSRRKSPTILSIPCLIYLLKRVHLHEKTKIDDKISITILRRIVLVLLNVILGSFFKNNIWFWKTKKRLLLIFTTFRICTWNNQKDQTCRF